MAFDKILSLWENERACTTNALDIDAAGKVDKVGSSKVDKVGSSPASLFRKRWITTYSYYQGVKSLPLCEDIHTFLLPRNAMTLKTRRHLHPEKHTSRNCKTIEDGLDRHQRKSPVNDRREIDQSLPEPDLSTLASCRAPRKSSSKANLYSRLSLEDARPNPQSLAP